MLLFASVTDTPTGLTAIHMGTNTVELSWSAPASNTPSVAGYEVFYAEFGSIVAHSGGKITNTNVNVTLPLFSVVYDWFVVAFSDVDNALPSARSNISTVYLSKCKHNY